MISEDCWLDLNDALMIRIDHEYNFATCEI